MLIAVISDYFKTNVNIFRYNQKQVIFERAKNVIHFTIFDNYLAIAFTDRKNQ